MEFCGRERGTKGIPEKLVEVFAELFTNVVEVELPLPLCSEGISLYLSHLAIPKQSLPSEAKILLNLINVILSLCGKKRTEVSAQPFLVFFCNFFSQISSDAIKTRRELCIGCGMIGYAFSIIFYFYACERNIFWITILTEFS